MSDYSIVERLILWWIHRSEGHDWERVEDGLVCSYCGETAAEVIDLDPETGEAHRYAVIDDEEVDR